MALDSRHLNYLGAFLFTLLLCTSKVMAQDCSGSFGDPVKSLDFGRGPSLNGAATPQTTNYKYVNPIDPEDGEYTIIQNTRSMSHYANGNGSWLGIDNHTPNDPNGYMMVVNASLSPGIFYSSRVDNLCAGATYEFAAWFINLSTHNGGIKPNIKFSIETPSGTILKQDETGEIQAGSSLDWKRFQTVFTIPSNTPTIVIKLINNAQGGGGNDFALDDITFRPCGPLVINTIDGVAKELESACEGVPKNITLFADVQPGGYLNPEFQWQRLNDNGIWEDVAGTTSKYVVPITNNTLPGTYTYRALIADQGNINSVNCRSHSRDFNIVVSPMRREITTLPTICLGEKIVLSAGEAISYLWTGPNGFTSTSKEPVIEQATYADAGFYTVIVVNELGCPSRGDKMISIIPKPAPVITAIDPICKGSSVMLEAIGGTSYRWSPAEGLSATNIPNPIANPLVSTTYTVVASNGICEVSTDVQVKVLEVAKSDAGPDQKMLRGRPVTLTGKSTGEKVKYFWTPSDYLDDPNKLNPTANPPYDMHYVLNTVSDVGCAESTDEVFVKVYQKVVIPSAFSPNGDGVNDVWNISAIDAFQAPTVKIMNRYGIMVFESFGYEKPWDGKYNSADLPPGVYYYLINLSKDLKPSSGSVMIIR